MDWVLSTLLVLIMASFFIFSALLLLSCQNIRKKKEKNSDNVNCSKPREIIFALAALTITILAIFIQNDVAKEDGKNTHIGTQIFLVYGLAVLFFSAFFSSPLIHREAIYHWSYSTIFAILSIYIDPTLNFKSRFAIIVFLLLVALVTIFCLHFLSFLKGDT